LDAILQNLVTLDLLRSKLDFAVFCMILPSYFKYNARCVLAVVGQGEDTIY